MKTMPEIASSISLASKYRPTSFATVLGQVHVVEVLRRAILNDKVPKQILFSGRSGLGKTTIARIVSACILCETDLKDRSRGDSCGTCASCLDIVKGTHPDVIEFDAASHGGKDEIRLIAERCQVLPLKAKYKIYIIDEAHGLSHQGGQAFLKLLEQPPGHVLFMLCTTDPSKMLKTNRGRCVEFELLPPTYAELVSNLERISKDESWAVTPAILDMVLQASDPDLGVRGTVMTLAKLASVLQDEQVSMEVIYSLLGTPSPLALAALYQALDAKSSQKALQALTAVRLVYSDAILRKDLVRWATKRVSDSLGGSETLTKKALWELGVTLDIPDSGPWVDVAIAKLSSTNLQDPQQIDQMLLDAKTVLAELQTTTKTSKDSSMSDDMAKMVTAAAPIAKELLSMLKSCSVVLSETQALLIVPDKIAPAIAPHAPSLRSAAGKLGLVLKMTKASTYRG